MASPPLRMRLVVLHPPRVRYAANPLAQHCALSRVKASREVIVKPAGQPGVVDNPEEGNALA